MTSRCPRLRPAPALAAAAAAALAALGAAACHQAPPPPKLSPAAQLEPTATLTVSVGSNVAWHFKAVLGAPELTVFDIAADALPFGTLLTGRATPDVVVAGKILGPEFRFGFLKVSARDLKACAAQVKATMALTAKNLADTGAAGGAVPYVGCEDFRAPQAAFDREQTFYWQIDAVAETLGDRPVVQALVAAAACAARGTCGSSGPVPPSGPLTRPGAPPTWRPVSISLAGGTLEAGSCASDDFDACRHLMPRCVWSLDRCVERRLFP